MTSDRLNWFLTIAANVGVVLGLGFLALELRQSTLATQATLHLDLVAYGRENAELLLSDEALADIIFRGERDPAALSPLEKQKFHLFTATGQVSTPGTRRSPRVDRATSTGGTNRVMASTSDSRSMSIACSGLIRRNAA
jgi:hypothetical protein